MSLFISYLYFLLLMIIYLQHFITSIIIYFFFVSIIMLPSDAMAVCNSHERVTDSCH